MFIQNSKLKILTILALCLSLKAMAQADIGLDLPLSSNHNRTAHPLSTTAPLREIPATAPDFAKNPYQISLFNSDYQQDATLLLSKTKTIFSLGLGVVGVLSAMPESVTNWNGDYSQLTNKWLDNVSHGPVWDRDDFYLNYLGHMYFGGVYYQSARKSGYRQWDSFIYASLLSTFYWEYGIEALAEKPSIQDLLVTPILGWLYGEWAFNSERYIWQQGATLLGSETLAYIALLLLDPVDSISRHINNLMGRDLLTAGSGYLTYQSHSPTYASATEAYLGLQVRYQLATGEQSLRAPYSSYDLFTSDPVDTHIIGVSAGKVWIKLASHWAVNNSEGQQFSLGLYFNRKFSSRLTYTRADLKKNATLESIVYENYAIDMQHYFNSAERLRPFISAGLGESRFARSNKQKQLQINAGLGMHYQINNHWALQTDWRHYYSNSAETNDQQLSATIIYRFGKGERPFK